MFLKLESCPELCYCSVAQLCLTLCYLMDCSMPGFPVLHHLLELAQTHPLPSPSPHTFRLSQHQGLFKLASSSHLVAKIFEFQLQHQSFQLTFKTDFLWDGSPCSPRDSQELLQQHNSKASILWCSAFFIVQLSHAYMTTGKTIALTSRTFVG